MRKYRTVSGDTWDLIAWRCYSGGGKERNMSALLEANSEHSRTVIFGAGATLNIPEEVYQSDRIIPPWRR